MENEIDIKDELDKLRKRLHLELIENCKQDSALTEHLVNEYKDIANWRQIRDEFIDSLLDNLGS